MKCTKEITDKFITAILSNREVDVIGICHQLAVPVSDYFHWTRKNTKFRDSIKEAIDLRKAMQQHELYFAEVSVKHKLVELLMSHIKTDKFEEKTLIVKEVAEKDAMGRVVKEEGKIKMVMKPVLQKSVLKRVKQDWLLKLGLPQIFPDIFQAPKAKPASIVPTLFEDYEAPKENDLRQSLLRLAVGVPKTIMLNGTKQQVGWEQEPNQQALLGALGITKDEIEGSTQNHEYHITMNLGDIKPPPPPSTIEDPKESTQE